MKRTDFFRKIATAVIALLLCQPATFGQTYRRIAGWPDETNRRIESFLNSTLAMKERKVAVFDCDGTLIGQVPHYLSEESMYDFAVANYKDRQDKLSKEKWKICEELAAGDNVAVSYTQRCIDFFAGLTPDELSNAGWVCYQNKFAGKFYPEMKELLARVEAVLRRAGGEDDKTKPRRLVFDKLIIDLDSFELIVDGKRIETPPKEMELLFHLASSPNRVFTRNQLLDETEKQARLLRGEIARTDSVAGNLSAKLERDRAQYGEMVREAYRNYKHNNYLTFLFSSRDFADVARKITALREVASLRERKLRDIEELTVQVRHEKEELDLRKRSLDSVTRSLSAQRAKLQRDARNAKASIRSMSQKEKTALQRKIAQEQQLDVAIGELRKLTKGNKEGDSFSTKTTGLRLPVTAGRVKRYKENMAEITGPKGAHVISIYDGKVVDVKRNRITNKYDVYVAHGEYITSYANMGSICVEKGQKVARNAQLGTIGSAVNIMTMETEYKLVFGIYPPNPGQKLRAENCFKK